MTTPFTLGNLTSSLRPVSGTHSPAASVITRISSATVQADDYSIYIHSAWSAARRWQMMRGAVGEEQPGGSRKASRSLCAHSVPHLHLPDERLLEVGR